MGSGKSMKQARQLDGCFKHQYKMISFVLFFIRSLHTILTTCLHKQYQRKTIVEMYVMQWGYFDHSWYIDMTFQVGPECRVCKEPSQTLDLSPAAYLL